MSGVFKFEYPVPLYRALVCLACKLGFDAHERMFSGKGNVCTTCGGQLEPEPING